MKSNERRITSNLYEAFLGFDNSLFDITSLQNGGQQRNFPPYDIVQGTDGVITIRMALAGYNKENIDISYSHDKLTVSGKCDKYPPDVSVLKAGISTKDFSTSWTVSADYEVSSAKMVDGLLDIKLSKRPDSKEKTIKIE